MLRAWTGRRCGRNRGFAEPMFILWVVSKQCGSQSERVASGCALVTCGSWLEGSAFARHGCRGPLFSLQETDGSWEHCSTLQGKIRQQARRSSRHGNNNPSIFIFHPHCCLIISTPGLHHDTRISDASWRQSILTYRIPPDSKCPSPLPANWLPRVAFFERLP